jgi:hypothetical protein
MTRLVVEVEYKKGGHPEAFSHAYRFDPACAGLNRGSTGCKSLRTSFFGMRPGTAILHHPARSEFLAGDNSPS